MPQLRVNVEYNFPKRLLGSDKTSAQETTYNYIVNAIRSVHPQVEGQMRRMVGRILTKLETAIDENLDTVDMDSTELDFLALCLKDCKLDAQVAPFVGILENEVENALKPQ